VKHGGGAPAVQAKAAERRTQAAAAEVLSGLLWNPGAAPITDPISEMQLFAGQMRHTLDHLGRLLGPGQVCQECGRGPMPVESPTGVAWLKQQRELRQLLEAMGRLGIASRAVEVQQGQADQMLGWLRSGLEAGVDAGLSRELAQVVMAGFMDALQRSRAGAVVAGELGAGGAA
jgi:hypothetical protein